MSKKKQKYQKYPQLKINLLIEKYDDISIKPIEEITTEYNHDMLFEKLSPMQSDLIYFLPILKYVEDEIKKEKSHPRILFSNRQYFKEYINKQDNLHKKADTEIIESNIKYIVKHFFKKHELKIEWERLVGPSFNMLYPRKESGVIKFEYEYTI